MVWVKFHDKLCTGAKRGLPRAVRFVFMELCLASRPGRGVIDLPIGMQDLDAIHDILGGNRDEVAEAMRLLTTVPRPTADDRKPRAMVELAGEDGARRLTIPSWATWNSGQESPGASTERSRKHRKKQAEPDDGNGESNDGQDNDGNERNGDATAMQRSLHDDATAMQRQCNGPATLYRGEERRGEKNSHTHSRAPADAHTRARDEAVGDELPPSSCTEEQLAAVLREHPAMLTDLRGGWLMVRGRHATPDAARRAIGAMIGQKGLREMTLAQKRALAAKYLNNQRPDYSDPNAGAPTASPDVRAVLELFAEEWERANKRKCIVASGDERHAAKLWQMARDAARPEGLSPLDLVRHWVHSYLRDDADRHAIDAGQPLALVAARVTKYGLPRRKAREAPTVDQQSAKPEPLHPLPSGDEIRRMAATFGQASSGEAIPRRRAQP
jgi:hypothetical protein